MRDHNYASMLPCWDWLSGTLHRAPQPIAARLRIEDKLPNSVALQLLHPFVPAPHAAAGAEPGLRARRGETGRLGRELA